MPDINEKSNFTQFLQLARKMRAFGGLLAMEVLSASRDYAADGVTMLGGSGADFKTVANAASTQVVDSAVHVVAEIAEQSNVALMAAGELVGLDTELLYAKTAIEMMTVDDVEKLLYYVMDNATLLSENVEMFQILENMVNNPEDLIGDPIKFAAFVSFVAKLSPFSDPINTFLLKIRDGLDKMDHAKEMAEAVINLSLFNSEINQLLGNLVAKSNVSLNESVQLLNSTVIDLLANPTDTINKAKELNDNLSLVTSEFKGSFFHAKEKKNEPPSKDDLTPKART